MYLEYFITVVFIYVVSTDDYQATLPKQWLSTDFLQIYASYWLTAPTDSTDWQHRLTALPDSTDWQYWLIAPGVRVLTDSTGSESTDW